MFGAELIPPVTPAKSSAFRIPTSTFELPSTSNVPDSRVGPEGSPSIVILPPVALTIFLLRSPETPTKKLKVWLYSNSDPVSVSFTLLKKLMRILNDVSVTAGVYVAVSVCRSNSIA